MEYKPFSVVIKKSDGNEISSIDGGITWQSTIKKDLKIFLTKSDGKKYLSLNSGITWSLLEDGQYYGYFSLLIFPNPVKNDLFIDTKQIKDGMYNLKILDLLGNVIIQQNLKIIKEEENIKLNMGNLSRGVYSLLIINEVNTYQQCFVKE